MTPNADRLAADWRRLSEFHDPDLPGWTRRPFTSFYRAARAWLSERMTEAGLTVSIDPGGNLVGRRLGREPNLPSIMVGSHSDTVMGGGRFDGMAGVLAAIEVARCLSPLRHTLEVVDFLAEEPTDFGISTIGSRAMAGALSAAMLALRDASGMTLADAITSVGGQPGLIAQRSDIGLYLELHIEQGPVLEREGLHLGVVSAITGICRLRVQVTGRADHAGTMPMALRRDALAAAAEMVMALEALWSDGQGVGTVGRLEVSPNATNVIPGEVTFTAEMRSTDASILESRAQTFPTTVAQIAKRRQVTAEIHQLSYEPATPIPVALETTLTTVLESSGHPPYSLPSYAGHDANQLAKLAPIGMLFIPSHEGRSHCPEEWTDLLDLQIGAQALQNAVQTLDAT